MRTGNPNKVGLVEWKPWSNEPGDAKSIILDASKDQAMVRPDTEELTFAKINEDMDQLGPDMKKIVQTFMSFYPGMWMSKCQQPSGERLVWDRGGQRDHVPARPVQGLSDGVTTR